VSAQNAVVRSTQIPTSIDQIWGTPDLLGGEHDAAYKALWIDIANDIEPSNVIEWLWINDILELSWEIRRLRGFKRELITRNFGGCTGTYFDLGLVQYKKLNELESSAEARRNAVFREIEWRRTVLAGRIRKASDSIIEGQATEHISPPPHPHPSLAPPPPSLAPPPPGLAPPLPRG
jgi:hypothetical protein